MNKKKKKRPATQGKVIPIRRKARAKSREGGMAQVAHNAKQIELSCQRLLKTPLDDDTHGAIRNLISVYGVGVAYAIAARKVLENPCPQTYKHLEDVVGNIADQADQIIAQSKKVMAEMEKAERSKVIVKNRVVTEGTTPDPPTEYAKVCTECGHEIEDIIDHGVGECVPTPAEGAE